LPGNDADTLATPDGAAHHLMRFRLFTSEVQTIKQIFSGFTLNFFHSSLALTALTPLIDPVFGA
jgi:hypothetical protein